MDAPWTELLSWLTGEEDPEVLRLLYESVSVNVHEVHGALKARGWAYADPLNESWPPLPELDLAAERLASGALLKSGAIGAAGALSGVPGIPPELAASFGHTLRLAQRMGIIYGFDPGTDKGRILLRRAIEAAYGLPAPKPNRPALRLSTLPATVAQKLPQLGEDAARWAASRAARRLATAPIRRATRWVPGLGPGLAAWGSTRQTRRRAVLMKEVYRAAYEGLPVDLSDVDEAVEVIAIAAGLTQK